MANVSPSLEDQTRLDAPDQPRLIKPDQFVISEESEVAETTSALSETVQPETVAPTPESAPARGEDQEGQSEDETPQIDTAIQSLHQKIRIPKKNKPSLPQIADALTLQVEKIMSEGLKDTYQSLTPIQQQTFKLKGEETAHEIRQLLSKTRVKIKHIFRLLLEWLKLLPGINIFFLEQEAKIKADQILSLKKLFDTQK